MAQLHHAFGLTNEECFSYANQKKNTNSYPSNFLVFPSLSQNTLFCLLSHESRDIKPAVLKRSMPKSEKEKLGRKQREMLGRMLGIDSFRQHSLSLLFFFYTMNSFILWKAVMPPNISLCVLVNKERHMRLEQHKNKWIMTEFYLRMNYDKAKLCYVYWSRNSVHQCAHLSFWLFTVKIL